jgi:acyl-ACP thioesterase
MDTSLHADKILVKPFVITTADADLQGRIRVGAYVNLLIQAAIESAEKLGFGYGSLQTQKLFWVLSRMTLDIYRPLQWNEAVTVETWPKNVEGILYLRDFIVRDSAGNDVARATSAWLAIDSQTKRPKVVGAEHTELFNALKDKHALTQLPIKLGKMELGQQFDFKSSFFDIDLNKHVTSTRYIDWLMDTFPLDKLLSNYPKQLNINYQKETMPGETIALYRTECDTSHYQFKGVNLNNNLAAYQAEIFF